MDNRKSPKSSMTMRLREAEDAFGRREFSEASQLLSDFIEQHEDAEAIEVKLDRARDLKAKISRRQKSAKLRYTIIIISVASIAISFILYIIPINEAHVEIEIESEDVYISSTDHPVFQTYDIDSLLMTDFIEASAYLEMAAIYPNATAPSIVSEFQPERLKPTHIVPNWDENSNDYLSARSRGLRVSGSDIALGRLSVPIESDVFVSARTIGEDSLVTFQTGATDLSVALGQTTDIECDRCEFLSPSVADPTAFSAAKLFVASPKVMGIKMGNATDVTVVTENANSRRLLVNDVLRISDIDFSRLQSLEQTFGAMDSNGSFANRGVFSSIMSGSIRFSEFEGRNIDLRSGDFVQITPGEEFYLTDFEFGPNLVLYLEGSINELITGTAANSNSQMPSLLAWWFENRTVEFISGSFLVIFGALVTVLTRLRLLEEG